MAKLTVITSVYPAQMSKAYALSENGTLVKGTTSAHLSDGTYEVRDVDGLAGMSALLTSLATNQVLVYGLPKHPEGSITIRAKIRPDSAPNVIARSNEFFRFHAGPAWMFMDYDPKSETALTADELLVNLRAACPELFRAGALVYPSASSHICNAATGEDYTGSRGLHIYIPVVTGADIPRASAALQEHLWEIGHGYIEISKSGALLERTILDPSVAQEAKLDFAAGAICGKGLEQRRGTPLVIEPTSKDTHLDTGKHVKDVKNKAHVASLKETAKMMVSSEASKVRERYATERATREAALEAGNDKPPQELIDEYRRRIIAAAEGKPLSPGFVIYALIEGKITPVSVRTILQEHEEYDGLLCLDPIEPDYERDKVVGKIYVDEKGGCINTFAHGGSRYQFSKVENPQIIRKKGHLETANIFKDTYTNRYKGYGLIYLEDTYYLYRDGVYSELSSDDLRSVMWTYLSACTCLDPKKGLVPADPDMTHISNVENALMSIIKPPSTSIPDQAPPPYFLHYEATEGNQDTLKLHVSERFSGTGEKRDPRDFLVMQNGLYDTRNDVLYPHTPQFYATSKLRFAYDPDAKCPEFLKYIYEAQSGDQKAVDELQKMVGYLISHKTHLQKIFGLFGKKRSGKGTLAAVLEGLVGSENIVSSSLSEMTKEFGLMDTINKKIMLFPDVKDEHGKMFSAGTLSERLLKLSGEDIDSVRRMRTSYYTGRHTVRLLMLGNAPPKMPEASTALSSRFVVFYFPNCWIDREDFELKGKLMAELPGIFNWAMQGLQKIYAGERIESPPSAKEIQKQLLDGTSFLPGFIEDFCDVGPEFSVDKRELFEAYKEACTSDGHYPQALNRFYRDLYSSVNGISEKRVQAHRQIRKMITGIRLKDFGGEVIDLPGDKKFIVKSGPDSTVKAGKTVDA
jgi:P4 family phage/plasmid primase-like protien